MGVEGFAGVALNADAVGVGGPFIGGGQGVGIHDDDVIQVLFLLDLLVVTGVADLVDDCLVHKEAGNPLGGAGLQQRHGQHVPGGWGGAVEHQVHNQGKTCHQKDYNGEQKQKEPADNAPKQAAFLFRGFLTHFSLPREVVLWDAKTQRCWIE